MMNQLRPAIVLTVLLTVLTGLIYPFVITGIAKVVLPYQASGSLIARNGRIVGSSLIGQSFTGPGYFHGRPSAAGDGYNAAASSGSNLGPTSKVLAERVEADIATLRTEGVTGAIPADLLTTSGSGLDPHISPFAAAVQVPRVAATRNLPEERVRDLVASATETRTFGILGDARVNVLRLNLSLDEQP